MGTAEIRHELQPTTTAVSILSSFSCSPAHALCALTSHSGFKELVHNFAIHDAGQDKQCLPTASTCENLLNTTGNG